MIASIEFCYLREFVAFRVLCCPPRVSWRYELQLVGSCHKFGANPNDGSFVRSFGSCKSEYLDVVTRKGICRIPIGVQMIEEIRADKRWNDVCRNETANREKNLAGIGYRMNRNRNIGSGRRRLSVCHGNHPRDGLSGTNRIRSFQDKPFHVRKSGALRCSCHETQENKRQKRNADLDDSVFHLYSEVRSNREKPIQTSCRQPRDSWQCSR